MALMSMRCTARPHSAVHTESTHRLLPVPGLPQIYILSPWPASMQRDTKPRMVLSSDSRPTTQPGACDVSNAARAAVTGSDGVAGSCGVASSGAARAGFALLRGARRERARFSTGPVVRLRLVRRHREGSAFVAARERVVRERGIANARQPRQMGLAGMCCPGNLSNPGTADNKKKRKSRGSGQRRTAEEISVPSPGGCAPFPGRRGSRVAADRHVRPYGCA